MSTIRIARNLAVRCEALLTVPLPAEAVWGRLRDFRRSARHDLFHAEIRIEGDVPRAGARLEMTHRFLLFGVAREGRILWWREGIGYSFSDLSRAGPRRGFPHVFGYRIESWSPRGVKIRISIRGRWTAWLIPRWAAWLWLRWVFHFIVINVSNEMLMCQLTRRALNTGRA